jgi:YHS domain-containing protein
MTKDPVCGMEVDEANACKATFDKDPAKYVG